MNLFHLITLVFLLTGMLYAEKTTIILIHGLLNNPEDIKITTQRIADYLPDAYIKTVNLSFGKWISFFNMFEQVEWLHKELNDDPQVTNNCIMIGHSKGGLIARYYVQRYNMPKVNVLITWGAPHQGIFGYPTMLDERFSWMGILVLYAYKLLYLYPVQKYISIAGYWKDPLHYKEYLEHCLFLPHANNEIEHPHNTLFRENLESLSHFVMVNSDAEEIITPSGSCHFEFYTSGSDKYTETFLDSAQYHQNLLGLKTLYDKGKLLCKVAHCSHMDYFADEQNFIENTLPYFGLKI